MLHPPSLARAPRTRATPLPTRPAASPLPVRRPRQMPAKVQPQKQRRKNRNETIIMKYYLLFLQLFEIIDKTSQKSGEGVRIRYVWQMKTY